MIRQLQQIAALYASNRQNWWIIGWVALMTLPALAFLAPDAGFERTGLVATQLIGFPVGGCVFLLFTQAKWQFCSSRARLLPGYAGPHLAVLMAIAVAFIGLFPLVPGLAGYNPLGAAAYAAAIAGTFLWSMHAQAPLANLVSLALLFSVYNSRIAAFWLLPGEAARWLPIHLAILVAGWFAIAAWLWRLPRLREDDEDYFIPVQGQVGSATRSQRTTSAKAAARQLLRNRPTRWICDWWHDRLTGVRAHAPAARQRLLRYGFGPSPAVVMASWMAVVFFVILWALSQSAIYRRGNSSSNLIPALNFFIIMPGIATLNLLATRRAFMSQELLLPLTRRQYIDGLLRAAARNAAVSWVVVHAALLALLYTVAPILLTWPVIAALTGLSLAAQLYSFGATSWVSQSAQGSKRIVLLLVALIPAFAAVPAGLGALGPGMTRAEFDRQTNEQIAQSTAGLDPVHDAAAFNEIASRQRELAEQSWRRHLPAPAVAWIAAAALAVAGAGAIFYGRRRWLNLELA